VRKATEETNESTMQAIKKDMEMREDTLQKKINAGNARTDVITLIALDTP
jgi:hypothetical protein